MELTTIPIDDVMPPVFRPVLHAWFDRRATGTCPTTAAMDPFVVPALAAHVVLIQVEGEDYTYRIVGESIRQIVQEPLKGRSVRAVMGDTEYYRLVTAQFRMAVARRWPYYSIHYCLRPDDQTQIGAWRIVLPYTDGERVTRLMNFQLFDVKAGPGTEISAQDLLPRTVFWIAAPGGGGPE